MIKNKIMNECVPELVKENMGRADKAFGEYLTANKVV